MRRRFNTAGPCIAWMHYMLPAMRRLPGVRHIIDGGGYFVVHAPRQVGKTTAFIALGRELTAEGTHVAVMLSMEVGAAFAHDPGAAEGAILSDWARDARARLPADFQPPPWPAAEPGGRLGAALEAWAGAVPRPLVLFLDEIDALRDETLVSVLLQLRSGYPNRPASFPWSLAVIGLRDVRDYKVAAGGSDRLGTQSPFNVLVESLRLRDFTLAEVAELYEQHTAETGQVFVPEAIERAFELTQGQPWLANALARQLVEVVVPDPAQPIGRADVDRACAILIERQDTHLDSLAERLREPRIKAILEPMLAGASLGDVPDDDRRFALDLGLVRRTDTGGLAVSNPIYREVIVRVLASGARDSLPSIQPSWLSPDGRLDPGKLLDAFVAFWRQHGQPLLGSAHYHEIAPHLGLMAFLHRVVNGGGTIEREYAIGLGRMELCLRYGAVMLGMELKVWRDGRPDPEDEGLAQLDGYLAGLGLSTGWLVIFDQRSAQPPMAERTTATPRTTPGGRAVAVVRG